MLETSEPASERGNARWEAQTFRVCARARARSVSLSQLNLYFSLKRLKVTALGLARDKAPRSSYASSLVAFLRPCPHVRAARHCHEVYGEWENEIAREREK